jgi:hypothetical protein
MVPYKRHCAETFEKILALGADTGDAGVNQSIPCENKTISRIVLWWKSVLPYFLNVMKSLSIKLNIPYNPAPAFGEIVRAVVNSGSWIFAHFICTRSVVRP